MNQGTGFLEHPAAEPSQGAAAVGQVLGGRYEVGSLLGHGGMADVYAARDRVLDRQVAVKVLRAGGGGHSVAERQSAEARILARLDHPHLVRVFDADTDPATGRPFLVMELVHGGTLTELLQGGSLPTSQAAALGEQLAGALAAIHQAGVVHRDVKPSNVLLAHPGPGAHLTRSQRGDSEDTRIGNTDSGNRGLDARLTDFGIARVLDATRLTTTGLLIGTAAYLSPEQARGDAVGCSSDVYSLGLVLLECLTGHPEYPGGPIESALARLNRQPLIPDDLGLHWPALLTAMTASDPTGRPTADQAAAALGDLSHGQPPTLTPAAAQPLPAPAQLTHPATPAHTDHSHTDHSHTDHSRDWSAGTLRREPRGAGSGPGRLARRCGAAVAVAAALITAVTLTGSPDATPTAARAGAAAAPPTSAPTGATNAQPAPTRGRASTTSAAAAARPLTTSPTAATLKRTSTGAAHLAAVRQPGTSRAAGSPGSGSTTAKPPPAGQARPVPTGQSSATTKTPTAARTAAPASAGSPTTTTTPAPSPTATTAGAGKSTNPKSHAPKPKKPKNKGKGNPHGK